MRVSQILCAAGPVDAVTNQALAYRSLFTRWGWSGEDYAPVQAHNMTRGTIRPLHDLRPGSEELLVLHYSGYAIGLERLLESAPPYLLVSHNITPPQYFWLSDPLQAVRCQQARGQLAELARRASQVAGVSKFNARELRELSGRDAEVIPVLFDRGSIEAGRRGFEGGRHDFDGSRPRFEGGRPPSAAGASATPPTVLFVGRLVPHKRQDLVIRAFARFRGSAPDAQLILVGVPLSRDFGAALGRLADDVAPGAVTFATGLSRPELWDRYRSADVFLCLSEHEGFCIPLLEAFHFGLPVIARDAGAVGEVVADAGVLLGSEDRIATVAELLRIVVSDQELRDELAARGARRLAEYDYEHTADRIRVVLTELAAA